MYIQKSLISLRGYTILLMNCCPSGLPHSTQMLNKCKSLIPVPRHCWKSTFANAWEATLTVPPCTYTQDFEVTPQVFLQISD